MTLISRSCGIDEKFPDVSEGFEYEQVFAKKDWLALQQGKISTLNSPKDSPKLIFSGSFNPLHSGHTAMQRIAENFCQEKLYFEVPIQNADKPALSYYEIQKILKQFPDRNLILSNAATFVEKAKIFPGCTFVIGSDTLIRILDNKFYGSKEDMNHAFKIFLSNKNSFLVFGRKVNESFLTLKQVNIPQDVQGIFTPVAEEDFRHDISSTELKIKREGEG